MLIAYLPQVTGLTFVLPEDESGHCVRVLRMAEGDRLGVVDGKGNLYTCSIAIAHAKRCAVRVESVQHGYGLRPFSLHVAIAPTKRMDRFEWFLEKATEIGVDSITPMLCHRSERKGASPERMARVAISAMKQSGRAYLPTINPLTPLRSVLDQAGEQVKLVAHCSGDAREPMDRVVRPGASLLVLIGPEGDFSPEEVGACQAQGVIPVSLGGSRLRTETAGVVACTLANRANGLL